MPNSGYVAGTRLEREVMEFLDARGYECFRSAGSHGYADVTAFNRNNNNPDVDCDLSLMYLWVSCKWNTARISAADARAFVAAAKMCGVTPVMAHRLKRHPLFLSDLERNVRLFTA